MSGNERVIAECERLKRIAASVHMDQKESPATATEVRQFEADAHIDLGDEFRTFLTTVPEGIPFVVDRPTNRFHLYSVTDIRQYWFGYERTMVMRFGPDAGQERTVHIPGTSDKGLLQFASNGCGDSLFSVAIDGPQGRRGQVLWYDHELDSYVQLGADLADFLRCSNDYVEKNINVAFFYDSVIKRIIHFPGTAELDRHLAEGLSINHKESARGDSLIEAAAGVNRFDIVEALLARGADPGEAVT